MVNAVIIPVFNEAATLPGVLAKIREFHKGPLIAVDDGSTDGSGAILERFAGLDIIRKPANMGYGQALIDGFARAVEKEYRLAITIDCDEQHEPAMIPEMFQKIGDLDVLSGSRYLTEQEGQDIPPEHRRKINIAITTTVNSITGYKLTDSFCGFKCYKVEALKKLRLDEPGYAMPLQFWIQAAHFGLAVKETPVPRIYKNLDRTFGGGMDDPVQRRAYYMGVLEKEVKRWSISSSWEPTRTI
ncbi:MAG: glycosyltransferase family 2 protein [Nitrospinota bacterium]|nr:glycosyltransferase family 2 protein [Nitrospinota bacterium]